MRHISLSESTITPRGRPWFELFSSLSWVQGIYTLYFCPHQPLPDRAMCRRVPWLELTNTSDFTSNYIPIIPTQIGPSAGEKGLANCCRYPNMHVSRGDCATSHIHYPAGRTNSNTCRSQLYSRVSCGAKLLTTCKWRL